MTSSQNVREIAFPDHTAEGFDPTVPFEAPNGTTYLWNGWGWDVVPKGVGGGDSEPDPRLPYLIETDKVTRKTKGVRDQGPEIDLVDAEGNYSNVKFEARNGVVVSSTPSSIVIDGTEEQEARESADNALNDLIVKQGDQFEADQQRQDETAAKDQLRQDEALAAEIATRQSKDQQHDGQLSTIEYKLDALIGLQFKGTYTFKLDEDCFAAYQQCVIDCAQDYSCITECTRAQAECESQKIAPGFFEAIDPDGQFDNLTQIIISKNDKSGMEIDWGSVLSKGDYLEGITQWGDDALMSPKTLYPSYLRLTTPAAAWLSISMAPAMCRGSMLSVSQPAPGCTGRTAWPATLCSSASCTHIPRRNTSQSRSPENSCPRRPGTTVLLGTPMKKW